MSSSAPAAAMACRPCARAAGRPTSRSSRGSDVERTLYTTDHEQYRATVREFLAREVVPHAAQWDADRWIDKSVFAKAAAAGIYALRVPEEFGGAGEPDYRFRLIVC